VYIIGGISDNSNTLKGLTYTHALTKNIETARLPIEEHFPSPLYKYCLNVNHVFEILINVAAGVSWKEAFAQSIPSRICKEKNEANIESEKDDSESTDSEVDNDVENDT